MFLFVVLSIVCVLGYYFYVTTHQPAQDPKFSSLITSINDVKSDETLYIKVKIDSINVRKINVIKNDNVVGTVSLNDVFKVTNIKKGATFYWYYIIDKDGRVGCIPSGSDQLFVETFKKKNDEEQILSVIKDYADEASIVITTQPSNSTTTTTTTAVTTTTQGTTTKATTTKKSTTKKINPTQGTTSQTTTKTIYGASFRIYSSYQRLCDDYGDCEYYLTVGACTVDDNKDCLNDEPNEFIVKLYDSSNDLIATNNSLPDKLTKQVGPGDYHATAQLVGTDTVATLDMRIVDRR